MHNYVFQKKKKHDKRLGFTLMELIVVMFIIASLSAIGFGTFFKLRDGALEKETRLFLNNLRANMESVKAETKVGYPTTQAELYKYLTGDRSYFNSRGVTYEVKPAMPELIKDKSSDKFVKRTGSGDFKVFVDSWKNEIVYEYNTGNPKYKNGIYFKSDGIDSDADATDDDIEL